MIEQRIISNPFRHSPLTWHDMDATCQKLLTIIYDEPSLKQLISKHGFRAWQYTLFRQNQLIVQVDNEINLTDTARGWVKRYTTKEFETGDLVTITSMEHITGYRTGQGRAFWKAQTDSQYVLTLFIEDFRALSKAGYSVPDFNATGKVMVNIDVLVSREMTSWGWRIAEIVAKVG